MSHPDGIYISSILEDKILDFDETGSATVSIVRLVNSLIDSAFEGKRFKKSASANISQTVISDDFVACTRELTNLASEDPRNEGRHPNDYCLAYEYGSDLTRRMFEVLHRREKNMINIVNSMPEIAGVGEEYVNFRASIYLRYKQD
jgi:hypothetical protein